MTEFDRRDFCNLLASGRGLPPVYDADALADAMEIDARAAEPAEYDEHEQDIRIDASARAWFRAKE